ncbi:MAG: DNA polymerase III subunit beta [Gammaproteobacteria bacterium]|nr:DNA polymerase III subunit beta [Gammaproteobacteria bacterium]
MKIQVDREIIVKPIMQVIGVVERRQTLPVLSNLLVRATDGELEVTATDLEVELVARTKMVVDEPGEITLPARKLADICRSLPDGATVALNVGDNRATLRSGRSRFTLSTLQAEEFPRVDDIGASVKFSVTEQDLRSLLERTQFAMAVQDVRYYLNGLLLEISAKQLRAVATDGHRLATCVIEADTNVEESKKVIVPRKGITELLRLLESSDKPAQIEIGENHLRVTLADLRFTSKLIDGRFPDYDRVIPQGGELVVTANREWLRQALSRTAILSNEKYRGVRLTLLPDTLRIQAHNPEQEEAEEEIEVQYTGVEVEIGFNVTYILDALAVLDIQDVTLTLKDQNSSCLIQSSESADCLHVVMPMRL